VRGGWEKRGREGGREDGSMHHCTHWDFKKSVPMIIINVFTIVVLCV